MATYKPPTQAHKRFEFALEGHILSNANVVIANTPSNKMNLIFKLLYPPSGKAPRDSQWI